MRAGIERCRPGASHQRGYGLILTLLVLVTGVTALLLAGRQPRGEPAARETATALQALTRAREALVARALADANRPGSLPCAAPDQTGSATFHGNDCDATAGRLPYRTLDIQPIHDPRAHEQLWYVLDPALRDRASQQPMNPQQHTGSLALDADCDGNDVRAHYAAVVIAPGPALEGQDPRSDARSDYLEGCNASGHTFANCGAADACNDLVRGITVDALFHGVQKRVLREVAAELQHAWRASHTDPHQRYLPYPADFGGTDCDANLEKGRLPMADPANACAGTAFAAQDFPAWVTDNEWLDLIVYHVDPACTEAKRNCAAAGLRLDGKKGLQALIAGAGRALGGQSRPGTLSDHLDGANNTDGDAHYVAGAAKAGRNDAFLGVRTAAPAP
jgi:hypothetical protein